MKVVTLTSEKLAPEVARLLRVECIKLRYHPFPDGEGKYILRRNLKNEKICYIESFYPDQFGSVLRTCFVIDLLKQRRASHITAVTPYIAFQRQDKPSIYESRSAEVVLDILSKSEINKLLTVDPHSEIVLKKYPFYGGGLDPSPCMIDYLKERDFDCQLIVATDDNPNVEKKMTSIAAALDLPFKMLHNHRDTSGKVHFDESRIKTDAKSAIIVDDIVAGGTTIKPAAGILRNSGIEDIRAVVTHVLASKETKHELEEAGIIELIGTDTVESESSEISVAPLIADYLRAN